MLLIAALNVMRKYVLTTFQSGVCVGDDGGLGSSGVVILGGVCGVLR